MQKRNSLTYIDFWFKNYARLFWTISCCLFFYSCETTSNLDQNIQNNLTFEDSLSDKDEQSYWISEMYENCIEETKFPCSCQDSLSSPILMSILFTENEISQFSYMLNDRTEEIFGTVNKIGERKYDLFLDGIDSIENFGQIEIIDDSIMLLQFESNRSLNKYLKRDSFNSSTVVKSLDSLKFSFIQNILIQNLPQEDFKCSLTEGRYECWTGENIVILESCDEKIRITLKNSDDLLIEILPFDSNYKPNTKEKTEVNYSKLIENYLDSDK